mgnify:CR=1 FL=1
MSCFIRLALIALAAAFGLFLTGAAQAAPNPCPPVIDEPQDGASVPPEFRIVVSPGRAPGGCKIDRVFVRIVDTTTGQQVYRRIDDCCDAWMTGQPVFDAVVPEEDLRPDRQYNIQVAFADQTGMWARMFRPGDIWEDLADERSAPAMIMVNTSEPLYRTARQAQNGRSAMVFAVDRTGRFGHAAAGEPDAARAQALDYCDRDACEIIDEPVRAQCHALAQYTDGAYWWGVGAAETEDVARRRAERFCEQNAPGACEVDYAYCQ